MGIIMAFSLMGRALMDDWHGPSATPRRQVAVSLLGPAEAITGMDVPEGLDEQPDIYLRVQDPADVEVRLPGGKVARLPTKYVSVNVSYGVVVDIHCLPLERTVPYKQAVAELHRLLGEMGIEPDEQMRDLMAQWPEDMPTAMNDGLSPIPIRARTTLTEETLFLVKLKPNIKSGWFLVLTFAAEVDTRLSLRPDAQAFVKEPSEDEAKGEDTKKAESIEKP